MIVAGGPGADLFADSLIIRHDVAVSHPEGHIEAGHFLQLLVGVEIRRDEPALAHPFAEFLQGLLTGDLEADDLAGLEIAGELS